MKSRTHTITTAVMSFSVMLLLTLQFLWIFDSYEKAVANLRRDVDLLFRTTVASMNHEMWTKKFTEVTSDSSTSGVQVLFSDSTRGMQFRRPIRKTVEIFTARKKDTGDVMQKRLPEIRNGEPFPPDIENFLREIHSDSLNIDTLRHLYNEALVNANIRASFAINHVRHSFYAPQAPNKAAPTDNLVIRQREHISIDPESEHNPITLTTDTIRSGTFRINHSHEYSVSLFAFRAMIYRQIMPQLLFSFFLTAMICGVFILMDRNLRSQERLMRSKNEFIGNISHELKTPVATVSVALEALKNFHAMDNPQLTQEYLAIATAELNRLSLLTDKILKTAVFEDKGVEYEPEAVDLRSHVEQVLSSMRLVFEKNKAKVDFHTVGDDFVLYGSATHLTNVVYNLLDNALKYCKISPSIKVFLDGGASEIQLSVKDNGIGIDPIYHKKVFEKFFRVPTGDVHDIKGYGLGLNYVASVIRRHSGTVVVVSHPGAGSEFIVSLPRNARR